MMEVLPNINSIVDLKKARAVVKGQITRADRLLEDILNIPKEVLHNRMELLEEHWKRFETIQLKIELQSNEEDLEGEIMYRIDLEERYYKVKDRLKIRSTQLTQENDMQRINTTNTSTSNQVLRPLTSAISFTPFQDDETFRNFIRRLEIFMHLHGQDLQPEDKVFILLHALSPSLHQKVYDLCAPDNPLDKCYSDLVRLLSDYVDPQPSTWALQHKFLSRLQEPCETVKVYSSELQKLTTDCDFTCENCGKSIASTLLRMQFIRGLRDTDIRARLLQEKSSKPFNDVVKMASTMDLAKDESSLVKLNNQCVESNVCKIDNKRLKSGQLYSKTVKPSLFDKLKGKCYRCGSPNHRANNCKFASETCHKCKRLGHIANVCMQVRGTNVHKTELEMGNDFQEDTHEIYKLDTTNNDKILIDVLLEGNPVQMELDTGSAISTLPYSTFKKLQLSNRLFSTQLKLKTYTGEVFKPKGVVFVRCSYKSRVFTGKLYIVENHLDPIFGRDWLREVKLDWEEVKTIRHETGRSLDELLNKYKDVFEPSIGQIPDQLGHLQLLHDARPIFMKARPIPYSLKQKVEIELERLEKAGILTKTENSEWGTPIVPVVKPNGEVRICADYKVTVNKQIKEDHYPIPKIEDIFANMNGGRIFCTLDLRNAYLHLKMDETSADIQTLSTHKGQFRVNRLMFGVKVAPGVWQRIMDKVLLGLDGIQCFFDDIIIQGKSEEELLSRLEKVLERLKINGLRLNRDKCKFMHKEIEYLGHKIDANGIHKSEEKVKAIKQARTPRNVSELRTFLGLVNYYNRFIDNLATILNPLHKLLQKGMRYKWTDRCEQSFQKVKEIIANEVVLTHFDPELSLILATDASPVGLGAVISHRFPDGSERPIAFASRTLTKPEEKYSQIDKEATGIYWGLKKFFQFCYGRKFTLITDHKPLVTIFSPDKNLPSMSATRIFNYSHFLSGFDYKIEFRRTNEHGNADFLSRFPIEKAPNVNMDQTDVFHTNQIETINLDHNLVARETKKDAHLKKIVLSLETGQSLEKLGYHDGELCLHDGCIMKGWRVMIPDSLKGNVLKELHFGHLGVVKTKALARSFCYWKGLDKAIEETISLCRQCREKQNAPKKEINHPWEPASQPWERIHLDFAGPTNGNYFLLVVDSFSKWVEVIPTKSITSTWTIKELQKLFTTFGLPDLLISDNGRQFTSSEFSNFLKRCGVLHKMTAPYHPSSNGQVERFVQTIKKLLKCMAQEPGTLEGKLHRLLMQIRQAPNSTGNCSYFLMFNRKIRTYLSLLLPRIKDKKKNPEGVVRYFKPGERVQARNYSGKVKWSFGSIQSKDGNVHYFIKMDDGQIWRRHVDQVLRTKL